MNQVTNTIIMIRPIQFRMNEQTAVNNYFQEDLAIKNQEINSHAQEEFDQFVQKLRLVGVDVIVIEDRKETDTPDSIFLTTGFLFMKMVILLFILCLLKIDVENVEKMF